LDSNLSLVLSGMLDLWITSSSHRSLCHCPHIDGTPPELFPILLICLVPHVITVFHFLSSVAEKQSLNVSSVNDE
jgi:hypothetical protein